MCREGERRFDRVGDVRERDVFGQEERDGEESGMVVSQAISARGNSRHRVRGSEKE